MALKSASDQLKDKIWSNMSQRAAETLKEELSFLGAVKVKEVELAQRTIVESIQKLLKAV